MDKDDYIQKRVDNQIDWYDKKSRQNQWWYKRLRIFEICAAASIPFLVGYIGSEDSGFRIAVGVLGLLIAVVTAILGLYQFQENWVEYRTTCESLKHEKFLFQTGAEPYHEEDPFRLFVQRIESLISKENTAWSQYAKSSTASSKTKS